MQEYYFRISNRICPIAAALAGLPRVDEKATIIRPAVVELIEDGGNRRLVRPAVPENESCNSTHRSVDKLQFVNH